MKAVVKTAAAPGAELREVPVPTVGRGEILVKVKAASICGSDGHIYRWTRWAQERIRPPLVFGHECCGEVVEAGPAVDGLRAGDQVSLESHIACGRCVQCQTSQGHLCQFLRILGVDVPGCFAEYVAIPAGSAWKNDPPLAPEVGTLLEPLGNAVYATLVEEVVGKTVAVFGCGPSGLFSIQVAKASGAADIIACDINPFRRELARKAGAHAVLAGESPELVREILGRTGGRGVDVALEMSGAAPAIAQALKVLRNGGRLSAFGLPSGPIELDFANHIIFKGIRLYGIHGREMYATWHRMAGLLRNDALDPKAVITHRFRLENFREALELLGQPASPCAKVLLIP